MGCGDFFGDPISLVTGGIVNGQGQFNPMGMLGGGMPGMNMMNPLSMFGSMFGGQTRYNPQGYGNAFDFLNYDYYTPRVYDWASGNSMTQQPTTLDPRYTEQSVANAIKGLGTDNTYQGHDRLWRNYNVAPHGQNSLTGSNSFNPAMPMGKLPPATTTPATPVTTTNTGGLQRPDPNQVMPMRPVPWNPANGTQTAAWHPYSQTTQAATPFNQGYEQYNPTPWYQGQAPTGLPAGTAAL